MEARVLGPISCSGHTAPGTLLLAVRPLLLMELSPRVGSLGWLSLKIYYPSGKLLELPQPPPPLYDHLTPHPPLPAPFLDPAMVTTISCRSSSEDWVFKLSAKLPLIFDTRTLSGTEHLG